MKKTLTATAVAGSALLFVLGGTSSAIAAPGDELVKFGGFDGSAHDRDWGLVHSPDQHRGWTVTRGLQAVDVGPANWDDPNGEGRGLRIYSSQILAGQEFADAGQPYVNGPWAALTGAIEQTLATEAGKTYQVTYKPRVAGWHYNSPQWTQGGNLGNVSINGEVASTFRTVVGEYDNVQSFTFTATGPATVLELSSAANAAVGIDSVSVVEMPTNDSPIMLPAIAGGVGLAAVAAGSTFLAGRKNKRSAK